MTACTDIQQKLPAYIDGTLTGEEKGQIEEHLSSCRTCTVALADLEKTGNLLRHLEEVEPPPWLTERIMGRVREEVEGKRTIFQRLFYPLHIKIPVEAFAALLVAVLGLYVYKATGPEITSVAPPQTGIEKSVPTEEPSRHPQMAPTGAPVRKDESPFPAALEKERGLVTMPPLAEHKKTPEKEEDRGAESSLVKETPSPEPAMREKGSAVSAGTSMGDQREGKRFRAQLPSQVLKAEKAAVMTVTIEVWDIATASKEIESLLTRFGATAVNKDIVSAGTVITATLPAKNLHPFHDELKVIGDIKPQASPSFDRDEGVLSLRLEVSGK